MNRAADENMRILPATSRVSRGTIIELQRRLIAERGDRWLKWRMLFLLAVASSYLLKLIFFRDIALANFDIPAGKERVVNAYLDWRIVSAAGVSAVYAFSYMRRWHFAAISWMVCGIALMAVLLDCLYIYGMASTRSPQWMFGLISLRCAAVACLLLNALHAGRPVAATRFSGSESAA